MKNKILKFIETLLIFFLTEIMVILFILLLKLDIEKIPTIYISTTSTILMTTVLILMYKKDLLSSIIDFKQNFKKYYSIGFKYWIIGIILMAGSNILLQTIFNGSTATNENLIQETIKSFPIISLILTSICAPISEEITFRLSFKKIIKNDKLFIIIAGLSFGLLHVLFSSTTIADYLYFIPYTIMGIMLATMYSKTKNICTSIFFHFLHNFIFTSISIITLLIGSAI